MAVAESHQLFLWVPVFFAVGIGIYFSLPSEPLLWPALGAGALMTMGLVLRARLPFAPPRWIVIALTAVTLALAGFCVAKARTMIVAAPVLTAKTNFVTIEGWLLEVEEGPDGRRMLIEAQRLGALGTAQIPERVRLTWRGDGFSAVPGDIIRLRGRVSPPPAPVAPGAYDFARQLYFDRVGGVGFAVSAPEVIEEGQKGFSHQVETVRLSLGRRIMAAIGSERADIAAVCVALVTGKRDAVPGEIEAALRDSGLAHLLAISGLHMGLVAGLLFFVSRFLLVQSEYLALHYPVKKWAAAIALVGASVYLLISGAAWSTQRAFIMAGIFFIAILLDRRALSLRNVAIAAMLILLMRPEALFQAGFQMSFAAVTVLIAAYEWWEKRKLSAPYDPLTDKRHGLVNRAGTYIGGLAMTSILAGWATGPFAMFHFNRIAVYGLAGNLLAMPFMGFLIMPAAIMGFILMPFGLDWIAWQMMAFGVEIVVTVAEMVSGWPGAVVHVPQMAAPGFLSIIAGGLMLCLLKTALRYTGMALIIAGFFIGGDKVQPDIIIAPGAKNLAFALEDRTVLFNRNRERFAASVWMTKAGQDDYLRLADTLPDLARDGGGAGCDEKGCTLIMNGGRYIAISEHRMALADDCARADIVITQFAVTERQKELCAASVIDAGFLSEQGTTAVHFMPAGDMQLVTNRHSRGNRPWTVGGEW